MEDQPLFRQTAEALRQKILGHQFKPGDKLPSEASLQEQFSVSRITVRQALSQLQKEGLVTKINGKGSFVTKARNAPALGLMVGFFDYMRARGREPSGKVVSVRKTAASLAVAKRLKIEADSPLMVITSVRYTENKAVSLGYFYMSEGRAKQLLKRDLEQEDIMELLETHCGYRLESNYIEATAVRAGVRRGRHLQVEVDQPLLRMVFVPHDISGIPLVYAVTYFHPDHFTYRTIIRR